VKTVIPLDQLKSHIGHEIGVSDWFVIDQSRIDEFARVTGDDQWIHVDVERAHRERGGTVAHGLLVLSLFSVLARSTEPCIVGYSRSVNYGYDRVRFTNFVPVGARVRLHQHLKAVEPKAGGTAVTRHCVLEIESQVKPALVADWISVLYAQQAA
jgi:acyl dehydratase